MRVGMCVRGVLHGPGAGHRGGFWRTGNITMMFGFRCQCCSRWPGSVGAASTPGATAR